MADADVPITAGSGTKIDTRTVGAGTDEHRQVVVVGDPSTAANVAAVSASGAVKVDIATAPQVAVNNVETLTDNAGFTDGASKLFPSGYVFDEAAGTALTENDIAAARVNANRSVVTVTEDGVTRGRYATVKAASTAAAATDPAQVVSLSPNSPVPLPTITKGTQGSTGVTTQDLKDAGRVNIAWTIDQFVTTIATEQIATVTESRDGAATTTFTSKTITNGKRLRLTHMTASFYAGGSTPATSRIAIKLRVNTAGAVAASSPLQYVLVGGLTATAKITSTYTVNFPDGMEFAGNGTSQIGVSITSIDWVTSTNTPVVSLSIFGFEY